ncbi:hypothetical protein H9Y05_03135 [Crocinitomicaceae bacterium CZZ-1]|uniref:Uncharacterized protein n=1 Tax=Taishania pollutisoli TaxID=2766479 RepID=A0A8J6P7N5_9FLAO|nr:hypothetical protein [Taishania pollutisoli]MBC9811461.1 hypothetical protein [Taishania pollutisoli]
MRKINYLALILLLVNSCNLPEMKKLNNESKKEIDEIINELKLEDFQYSFHQKTTNENTKKAFFVDLSNIDDSTDFKPYNDRIISAFEKSGYDFKDQDFIRIGYFKQLMTIDLYVYYEIDPRTKQIIKEGSQ